ncbi:GDSL-type esterase/lipase family protein [Sphingomonas sp.]|uniref:GDSL-type esterase/lipase family protein n=1 Tax=Sphingomonas sp. TaxID=28214 RepID=UPI003CC645C5
MIAALLGLAQAMTAAPAPPPCTLCDAERLRPFLEKLAHARRDARTVRILQLGDSHTAGDQVTGAWRAALQTRYGDAGRGVLAPGRPYQGYLTRNVTAAQSPGWSVAGIFGATYSSAGTTPVGLSNFSLTTVADGATLSIAADRTAFDRFTVCALAQPGGGTLTLRIGTASEAMPLDGDRIEPRCHAVDTQGPAYGASLTAGGGPVTITSMATERVGAAGVELSNLGTVGAQMMHMEREDDRLVAAEVAQYRPDLLVVAFGTNEAYVPRFSAAEYEARLRGGLARLRRLLPGVPTLILGAPDSATKLPALQAGSWGSSAPCVIDTAAPPPFAPPPLLAAPAAADWRPTAALPLVQAIQRRVAHATGAAFWDWGMAMGGRCTATRWALGAAPLMRPDRVHFSTAGGVEIARLLQADLDAAAANLGIR